MYSCLVWSLAYSTTLKHCSLPVLHIVSTFYSHVLSAILSANFPGKHDISAIALRFLGHIFIYFISYFCVKEKKTVGGRIHGKKCRTALGGRLVRCSLQAASVLSSLLTVDSEFKKLFSFIYFQDLKAPSELSSTDPLVAATMNQRISKRCHPRIKCNIVLYCENGHRHI